MRCSSTASASTASTWDGWIAPANTPSRRRFHGAGDDWLEKAEKAQPFGRLIKPAEVAEVAAFLLSERSGLMTGSIIDFDQNVMGTQA